MAGLKREDDQDHLTDPLEHNVAKYLKVFKNGFHVAVRLFSNRSQMTSKCGKNKKMGSVEYAECGV